MTTVTDDQDDDTPRFSEPERETVRVRPMYLPRELMVKATCAQCGQLAKTPDVFVIHIDRAKDEADQIKAQSYMVCSQECCDIMHAALTVEAGMMPIQTVKSQKNAILIAQGSKPDPKNDEEPEAPNAQQLQHHPALSAASDSCDDEGNCPASTPSDGACSSEAAVPQCEGEATDEACEGDGRRGPPRR